MLKGKNAKTDWRRDLQEKFIEEEEDDGPSLMEQLISGKY